MDFLISFKNKHLQKFLDPAEFPFTVIRIIALFWLIAKLLSIKLWTGNRLYPVIPVHDFLNRLPLYFHNILFYISLAFLALAMLYTRKKILLAILLVGEILSCLLDVTRWQPWEYQYIFIVLLFVFSLSRPKHFYTGLLFLLSSIYIFSGLHKLNGGFLYSIWDNFILNDFFGMQHKTIARFQLHYIGLIIPLTEIIAGFLLMTNNYKKSAAIVLIATHIAILILLGPAGANYNSVVWPWNIAMMLLLYLLIFRAGGTFRLRHLKSIPNAILILFWGVVPILSFAGYWDNYLSSSLYSGNLKNITICMDSVECNSKLQPYIEEGGKAGMCTGNYKIKVYDWAMDEINVPPYPEGWYYKKFMHHFKEDIQEDANFIMYSYPYKYTTKLE